MRAKAACLLVLLVAGEVASAQLQREALPPSPRTEAEKPVVESPEAVHQEFLALCRAMRASRDPYYGEAQVEELRRYLTAPVEAPLPRVLVRARLGAELLRLGEESAAVELLDEARRIAAEAGDQVPREIRLDVLRWSALAYLRLGERRNCVAMHGATSCILPFDEAAVHRDKTGATKALELYLEYLAHQPDALAVRWLANVAAMALGRYPEAVPERFRARAERLRSPQDIGRFPEIATRVGIRIVQPSGGAVMDDFDGDGHLDIVTSTIDPCGAMNLYRNDGRGRFMERTRASNLWAQLGGLNVVHADYDNDGDLDLLVLRGGWMGSLGRMRNSLLRNRGDSTFEDVTRFAGLASPAYPTQAGAWADYDLDGDLDLYLGNEADDEGRAYPSQLYRNEGDGTFTDVARTAGVTNERMAKAVAWGDYDNDGDPDLYVSNIGPNRLYRNNGDGTFTDVAEAAGVVEPAGRSFPCWFFDYDNDGWLDLFVADYGVDLDQVAAYFLGLPAEGGHPRLYRNRGDGTFADASREAGLDVPCLPMGSNYGDLDNDGWLDIYLGVGTPSYESVAPNLMFRNAEGRRFVDVTYAGGFGHLQKGHGVAFGDLDHDGDQDIFEQMGGAYPGDAYPSVLYENPGAGHHWVTLRLVGTRANRSAIGARLRLRVREGDKTREIHVLAGSGGSFGGSSLEQEIGLGEATRIEELEIRWPARGSRQLLHDLQVDQVYEIVEGSPEIRALERRPFRLGGPGKGATSGIPGR